MKWAEVNTMLRNAFNASVQIEPAGHAAYFRLELFETDTFHPWDTDGELCRLTHNVNLAEADQEEITDAAWECLGEMEYKVEEWFQDRMNHTPSYTKPTKLVIRPEVALDLFIARLLDPETV